MDYKICPKSEKCDLILRRYSFHIKDLVPIDIGVSSIGAGGARAPPDFRKCLQQCTKLLKVVHQFEQSCSVLDAII